MKKLFLVMAILAIQGCFWQDVKPQQSLILVPPAQAQCNAPDKYRKSVLLIDWQQTSPADSALPPMITQHYIESLRAKLHSNTLQLFTDYQASLIGLNKAQRDYPSVAEQIKSLARRANVQYVLQGSIEISDHELSALSGVADYLDFRVMGNQDRELRMELSIYDGITGARMAYSTFRLDTEVARYYQRNPTELDSIRLSDVIGKDINQLLVSQANFVKSAMGCLPLQARVVRKYQESLILDVGSFHGVEVGDNFKIARRQDWGKYRSFDTGIQFADYNVVQITQVGIDSSKAIVLEDATQDVSQDDFVFDH